MMQVDYPYCRHCSISRLKKSEQISHGETINGKIIIRCFVCNNPLATQRGNNDAPRTFKCPDCGGEKSWQAYRCKQCYKKLKMSRKYGTKSYTKFRDKIREKLSEIADESGTPNYWKTPISE